MSPTSHLSLQWPPTLATHPPPSSQLNHRLFQIPSQWADLTGRNRLGFGILAPHSNRRPAKQNTSQASLSKRNSGPRRLGHYKMVHPWSSEKPTSNPPPQAHPPPSPRGVEKKTDVCCLTVLSCIVFLYQQVYKININ
jgi:hypothetical protein